MIESTKIFIEYTWTDSAGVTRQSGPVQYENKEIAESVAKIFCKNHLKKHPRDLVRYGLKCLVKYEIYSIKTVRKILSSNQFIKTS